MTDTIQSKTNSTKNSSTSLDLIKLVEEKFRKTYVINNSTKTYIEIGDIIRIGYIIPEGDKERIQYYEGLVIAQSNRGLGRSFTIRRNVQGVGIEQIFPFHSPKIVSITRKQSSKVRRAKLYFIRSLNGKSTRLKIRR